MIYTTYKTAADTYKRDYPFADNWATDTDIKEWIGACMFEISPYMWLQPKVLDCSGEGNPCVNISNYKGVLPIDFVALSQGGIKRIDGQYNTICMPSFDSFFIGTGEKNQINSTNKTTEFRFSISGNIITTSFEEGTLQVSYLALPMDELGDPMIPNEPEVIACLSAYIGFKVMSKLYLNGQVTRDKVDFVRQDLLWKKGLAFTKIIMPSNDEINESLKDFNSIIRPKYSNYFGYRSTGNYHY